jgi:hypothetical protein
VGNQETAVTQSSQFLEGHIIMRFFVTLTACGLVAFSTSQSSTATDPGMNIQALRERILAAKDSAAAGAAYRDLFKHADRSTMDALCNEPDTSIALQARKRVIEDKKAAETAREPARLIGFLEGRLGMSIPLRWEHSFVMWAGRTIGDDKQLQLQEAYRPIATFMKKQGSGWLITQEPRYDSILGLTATKRITFKVDGPHVVASEGKATCRLKKEFVTALQQPLSPSNIITAHFARGALLLAVHDHDGDKYNLACFDIATGTKRWQREVWAAGAEHLTFKSGFWSHYVEFVSDESRVALFGRAGYPYLEVFDLKQGTPLVRFSANNWYVRE